jgi:hypothetical protein
MAIISWMKTRNEFERSGRFLRLFSSNIPMFGWRHGEGNYEQFSDDSWTSDRDLNQLNALANQNLARTETIKYSGPGGGQMLKEERWRGCHMWSEWIRRGWRSIFSKIGQNVEGKWVGPD